MDAAAPAKGSPRTGRLGDGPRWCLIGAAVAGLGLFLPWSEVELHLDAGVVPAGVDPVVLNRGLHMLSFGAIALFPLAVVLAVVSVRRARRLRGGWITVGVLGLIVLIGQVQGLLDPSGVLATVMVRDGVEASTAHALIQQGVYSVRTVGPGGLLVALGTVLVTIGAILAIRSGSRRHRDTTPSPPSPVPIVPAPPT